MKIPLLGMVSSIHRWPRVVRWLGAAALSASASVGFAQSLAFTTLAGTAGVTTPFSNSAPVTFNNPYAVAVDTAGNVYVADTGNHVIRRITAAGAVSTLAGVAGTAPGATDDATANAPSARFNSPQGIALNAAGDRLYVADSGNHTIRVVALTALGGSVTGVSTLAGTPGSAGSSNSGTGFFNTPRGIAADTLGNLYVADSGNHLIRKVIIASSTVSTVAGLAGTQGATNGNDTQATFSSPYGVAVNSANDTLYIADFNNHLIRRIALTTPIAVTTLAGVAGTPGFVDASGTSAAFRNPTGVAVAASGDVFVSDFGNNAVRQISIAAGNTVSTPAGPAATGTLTPGASGVANGTGTAVRFTGPIGIATRTVSSIPYVYVADTNNQLIRQGAVPSLPAVGAASPATQTAAVGATGVTFTASVTGGWPTPVLQWQIQAGGVGAFQNLAASSTYQNVNTTTLTIHGVTAAMNNDRFRLIATTSSTVEGAPATLAVNQGPSFASSSVNFTAVVGRSNTFIVAAAGSSPITYSPGTLGTFTVETNGTIRGTPLSTSETTSGTITATNPYGSAAQFVAINVVPESSAAAPVITSAASANFSVGQNNNFTFTASGAPTPIIGLSGTLPAGVTFLNGLLSGTPANADNSPFTLTVSASNGVGTATQVFTLSVTTSTAAPTFVTQPGNAIGNLGQTATFTAAVTGSPSPTLRWQRQASGSSGGFADLFDDATYSGTSTTTLTIRNLEAGMTGDQFRLVASNTLAVVPSSIVTLTVNVGTVISTFAGVAGVAGSIDGIGINARFNTPSSIAADAQGNFYVADAANHIIRRISSGGNVTTLAGLAGTPGSSDGVASAARFTAPSAVAVSAVGTVFVADTFNHTIRAISSTGVSTVAGLAGNAGSADGVGANARFASPSGIAVDNAGTIYVSDSSNHTIRRILSNGTVSVLAGAAGVAGSADHSTGTSARFNYPGNLAVDNAGNLYVADTLNHTIRRVNTSSGSVTTIAGTAGVVGALDANGTAATFNRPFGVAVDNAGNIFVADTNNHAIRRIASSGTVTTLAGFPGQAGAADGAGSLARFNEPFALAIDPNGNLFIADTRNHTIRRSGTTSAPIITTQPQNRVAPVGGTTTFRVVATGTPAPSYQWQRQAANTSGFVNLSNEGSYSGANTATLTVSNVLSSHHGDLFRVVVSNGVNPNVTSGEARLLVGEAAVFTSASSTTIRATDSLLFTFTTSGSPASSFTASTLPPWATLSTAGVLSGTPPAGSEGQYTFTVTADNGVPVTQTFTLTVTPAVVAPTITVQPVVASVAAGQAATFSVTATGTAPLNYQWQRNGAPIPGATGSSYTVGNVQPSMAGTYRVAITNTGGAVLSNSVDLVVNTEPVFTAQPRMQTALAGSNVTFVVAATGSTSFSYQWRKNGVPIAGATDSSLNLTAVTAADVGIYDVIVTNAFGTTRSSVADLAVVTAPTAPVITAQPASRAARIGTSTTLAVGAAGAPAPTYQWRKDGTNIPGATAATLSFANVQAGDAASYDVVITNGVGSAITSSAATLRTYVRSYAGIYLGTLVSAGDFGLYVREDNTGVFTGYVGSLRAPIVSLNVLVEDGGQFSFTHAAGAAGSFNVSGAIAANGGVTGSVTGAVAAAISGSRAADSGVSQSYAGYYRAGSATNNGIAHAIVGAAGNAHVVVSGPSSNGGSATVSGNGQISLVNSFGTTALNIDAGSGLITGSSNIGGAITQLSGGSDAAILRQRLVNISSRARVAGGDSVAIAGFVIAGEESKPVLIRAVGPTLGGFGVSGTLATPRLELFRGSTSQAVNTGVGTGAGRVAIDAAGAQSGAFALGAAGTDAAILTTLAPGNYTAVVSGTNNAAGVALVEVYDLSAVTPGQKLLNIATRAAAGAGDNTLIAGFVVPPGSAKRVLLRAVGPGLTPFGVTGVLAQPVLTLTPAGSAVVIAQNTNWSTSADAAAITATSVQVGAFGLAPNDSALIVTLAPGNYTAQVTAPGTATGVALIEVYELP